jgi:hypothetical protein
MRVRLLRFGLGLAIIGCVLAAAVLFLRPKDRLQVLQPYVLTQSTIIAEAAGPFRMRTIYLGKISPTATKDLLLKLFPKSRYRWSGGDDFFDMSAGITYSVFITPVPNGTLTRTPPPTATTLVTEFLLMDKRTDFWERQILRRRVESKKFY